MLNVLLLILKITGIILACILGLLVLLILWILFSPIKYKVNASYNEKPKVLVKVSWLLHIIRFRLSFDEELDMNARVLFFEVFNNKPKDETKKKKKKSSVKKKKDSDITQNVFSDEEPEDEEIILYSKDSTGDETPKEADSQSVKESDDKTDDKSDNKSDNKSDEEQDKATVSSNQSVFERIKKLYYSIINKIKELIKLVKQCIDKAEGAKDNLVSKLNEIKDTVNNPENQEFVRFILDIFRKLIKQIKPRKYDISGTIGFEDPSTTGTVFMYLSIFYGFTGMNLNIKPDFEDSTIDIYANLKGHFNLFGLLIIALKVYRNKTFKKLVLNK